jgi:hypothetical protein
MIFASSCATNRSIVVTHPLERKLASYHNLGVDIKSSDPKASSYLNNFKLVFIKMARKESGFERVGMHDATKPFNGTMLMLTVTEISEGDKAARTFNMGGEAEWVVKGVMRDGMSAAEITAFEAKGNSRRTSKTTMNGFDTGMGGVLDDMVGKAMTAASEQIVSYLKENQ